MYEIKFTLWEAEVHFLCAVYQKPTTSDVTEEMYVYVRLS